MSAVGIVGPGRAGLGIGLALAQAGHEVRLHGRRGKPVPPPLELSWGGPPPWLRDVGIVLLAVPDPAIGLAAEALAASDGVTPRHVVLHLSGLVDHTALGALRPSGAALGSLHPLQAISEPEAAPQRLVGALAAIEGDERAVAAATALASAIGLHPVVIDPGAKPGYHAGAVVASNYLVVLAALAERLFTRAGLPTAAARQGLAALMRGTVDNVAREGPLGSLTGPIVRGDADAIRQHLATLDPGVARIYRALGRAALELAKLDDAVRRRVERALEGGVE